MPHYTNLGLGEQPTRRVCKYCGRPISQNSSMNQGCGEVCRMKHRNARYRVIEPKRKEVSYERFDRYKENE